MSPQVKLVEKRFGISLITLGVLTIIATEIYNRTNNLDLIFLLHTPIIIASVSAIVVGICLVIINR